MVIDVEHMYTAMNSYVQQQETFRVFGYLFRLLRKCIQACETPVVEGPLGIPPFEKPSIHKAITNFVMYKFTTYGQQEWNTMYELSKYYLHCLNTWEFPAPSTQKHSTEEATSYKIDYTRWLVFCHIPTFCDSLKHYDTTMVFGKNLLRAVFEHVRKQIMDQLHQEREKMLIDRRVMILTHLPTFLSALESELHGNSPIWDPEFKPPPSIHLQNLLEANKLKRAKRHAEKALEEQLKNDSTPIAREKRKKLIKEKKNEDISTETVAEIIATIDDPNYMIGPDVRIQHLSQIIYI